jgi:hypothetical protein
MDAHADRETGEGLRAHELLAQTPQQPHVALGPPDLAPAHLDEGIAR